MRWILEGEDHWSVELVSDTFVRFGEGFGNLRIAVFHDHLPGTKLVYLDAQEHGNAVLQGYR